MKDIVSFTMQSVSKKINLEERKYCFEIFGFDFIIDLDFNIWLIEVNTNPCLEIGGAVLSKIIPNLIE